MPGAYRWGKARSVDGAEVATDASRTTESAATGFPSVDILALIAVKEMMFMNGLIECCCKMGRWNVREILTSLRALQTE